MSVRIESPDLDASTRMALSGTLSTIIDCIAGNMMASYRDLYCGAKLIATKICGLRSIRQKVFKNTLGCITFSLANSYSTAKSRYCTRLNYGRIWIVENEKEQIARYKRLRRIAWSIHHVLSHGESHSSAIFTTRTVSRSKSPNNTRWGKTTLSGTGNHCVLREAFSYRTEWPYAAWIHGFLPPAMKAILFVCIEWQGKHASRKSVKPIVPPEWPTFFMASCDLLFSRQNGRAGGGWARGYNS